MHLLPGLAMFVTWHLGPGTLSWHDYRPMPAMRAEFSSRSLGDQVLWRFVVPLLCYGLWQLWYWLVVQVLCEGYIQSTGRDTSYRCLTRRAKKAGNILAKIVLHGSKARRIFLYGELDLGFGGGCIVGATALIDMYQNEKTNISKTSKAIFCSYLF